MTSLECYYFYYARAQLLDLSYANGFYILAIQHRRLSCHRWSNICEAIFSKSGTYLVNFLIAGIGEKLTSFTMGGKGSKEKSKDKKADKKSEKEPEPKSDQEPEQKSDKEPELKADQEPEQKSGQEPEQKSDKEPEQKVDKDSTQNDATNEAVAKDEGANEAAEKGGDEKVPEETKEEEKKPTEEAAVSEADKEVSCRLYLNTSIPASMLSRAIIGPQVKRHFNGVSLAGR